jgi:hypothetical protein
MMSKTRVRDKFDHDAKNLDHIRIDHDVKNCHDDKFDHDVKNSSSQKVESRDQEIRSILKWNATSKF